MVDDSTGNGNTLLLSAGKLCGTEMETIAEAYPFQGFCGQRNTLLFGNAGVDQRQINIFKGGLLWQQVKALENETDIVKPRVGKLIIGIGENVLPVQMISAGSGFVQTADNIHQRCFAGTGGAHDRQIFPFRHGEGNVLQNVNLHASLHIVFINVF